VAELAYRSTLADLRKRRDDLAPIFARHGLSLREEVLHDTNRSLLDGLHDKPPRKTAATSRLRRALDDLGHAVVQKALPVGAKARAVAPVRRGPRVKAAAKRKTR